MLRVGVTLDYCITPEYAKTPWYAIRANYIEALAPHGVAVQLLHYEYKDLAALVGELDGLVITGGGFDVNPALYGEWVEHERVNINDKRTSFEFGVCREAMRVGLPILGICGGEQLINVVAGGSLIQHIPQEITDALEHEQKTLKHLPSHEVSVVDGTLLHSIVGANVIETNSTHHQAVKKVAPGFVVNARTEDGVIEGIEWAKKDRYVLGVQWHPEYCYLETDKKIINSFVEACRTRKKELK